MSDQTDGSAQPTNEQPTEAKQPEVENNAPEQKSENKTSSAESRINQLTARAKKAEEEKRELQAKIDAEREAKLQEEGKLQELVDTYKDRLSKAESTTARVEQLEKTVNGYLETQLQRIPEEKRALIPESFTTEQKLDYISQNSSFLLSEDRPKPVNPGAPIPKNDASVNNAKQDLEEKFKGLLAKKRSDGYLSEFDKSELMKITKQLKEMEKQGA